MRDRTQKINKLIREINEENKKLSALRLKHGNDLSALSNLPEFTDPTIVVPQTCKRQLLVYLQARQEGLDKVESLKTVFFSRYDTNPVNPKGLSLSDFKEFLQDKNVGLPEVCKEILRREQNPKNNEFLQAQLDTLVEKYFTNNPYY